MREGPVLVALSGGVDSAVAAALLVEQGYEVSGVTLELWVEPPPGEARHQDGTHEAARASSHPHTHAAFGWSKPSTSMGITRQSAGSARHARSSWAVTMFSMCPSTNWITQSTYSTRRRS